MTTNADGDKPALKNAWWELTTDDKKSTSDSSDECSGLSTLSINSLLSTSDDRSFESSNSPDESSLTSASDGSSSTRVKYKLPMLMRDAVGSESSSTESDDEPRASRKVVMRPDGRTARRPALAGDGGYKLWWSRRRKKAAAAAAAVHHRHVCVTCRQTFADKVGLWRHVHFVHGRDDDRYLVACLLEGCSKRFSSAKDLDSHSIHHRKHEWAYKPAGGWPCICGLCGILTENVTSLFQHIRELHNKAMLYTCGVCVLLFGDGVSAGTHVRRSHSSQLRGPQYRFRCNVCGQLSSNERRPRNHSLRH